MTVLAFRGDAPGILVVGGFHPPLLGDNPHLVACHAELGSRRFVNRDRTESEHNYGNASTEHEHCEKSPGLNTG